MRDYEDQEFLKTQKIKGIIKVKMDDVLGELIHRELVSTKTNAAKPRAYVSLVCLRGRSALHCLKFAWQRRNLERQIFR